MTETKFRPTEAKMETTWLQLLSVQPRQSAPNITVNSLNLCVSVNSPSFAHLFHCPRGVSVSGGQDGHLNTLFM